jgi:hypothetical protein
MIAEAHNKYYANNSIIYDEPNKKHFLSFFFVFLGDVYPILYYNNLKNSIFLLRHNSFLQHLYYLYNNFSVIHSVG